MAEKKKPMQAKYPAGFRNEAKKAGLGVITVSVVTPSGDQHEVQVKGSAAACRFARWVGILLSNPELEGLIDLEDIIRQQVEQS